MLQLGITLLLMASAALPQSPSPAPDSARQSALAFEQQGQNSQAETAWHAWLQSHPADPEPYAHLGLLEARQEHYKQALPLYRKALSLKPSFPGLRLNLALALFKAGDLKEAIPQFTLLLKSAPPDSPEAQRLTILLGMAHYGAGQFAQAVPLLESAAAHDPQSLPLRLTLAHSCLWSKQYQCVLDVYHEILTLNAESAEADMLAGEASDEMHDRGGAVDQFRAAVKANPKEPNVHFGLAYLLWKQRQLPEAAIEFQAELANDPGHVQSMLYLGDTYLQLNRPDEARPLLVSAAKLNPSLWLAHLDLGMIDADADKQQDALREMLLAAKLKPDEVTIHWHLGKLYRSLGKRDEAKAEFNKANSINRATDEGVVKKMSGARLETGSNQASPAPQ